MAASAPKPADMPEPLAPLSKLEAAAAAAAAAAKVDTARQPTPLQEDTNRQRPHTAKQNGAVVNKVRPQAPPPPPFLPLLRWGPTARPLSPGRHRPFLPDIKACAGEPRGKAIERPRCICPVHDLADMQADSLLHVQQHKSGFMQICCWCYYLEACSHQLWPATVTSVRALSVFTFFLCCCN